METLEHIYPDGQFLTGHGTTRSAVPGDTASASDPEAPEVSYISWRSTFYVQDFPGQRPMLSSKSLSTQQHFQPVGG